MNYLESLKLHLKTLEWSEMNCNTEGGRPEDIRKYRLDLLIEIAKTKLLIIQAENDCRELQK